jgi:outer membrane receptor protein involved in Fe transport
VPETTLNTNRTYGDLLFQFDRLVDRNQEIGLDGSRRIGSRATINWFATTEWRTTTNVRTVALAPGFGDTKHRDARLRRTLGSIQVHLANGLLPIPGAVVAGAEYGVGSVDSRYFLVASGDYDAYANATGGRGELDASADAGRSGGAAFLQYAARPMPRVRFTVGARYDWLDDSFDPVSPAGQTGSDVTHEAFSPKAGVNVRYLDRGTTTGNVYVTAGRSFKAPTLDQLFDVRNLPVPFPPFSIRSSNANLKPQTGTNVEAGIYQTATFGGGIVGSLAASVYQMEMTDEIDFDVATLSYGNIAESRHRGAELGARVIGPGTISSFASYTLQAATIEAGDNTGNQLKAIPRHTVSAGASFSPIDRVQTGVNLTRVGEAFIDDANTRTLPAYTRVDARLGVRISAYEVFGEARNLFGAKYNTTGFLDPSGSGTAYYYPAAERVLMLGVRTGVTR